MTNNDNVTVTAAKASPKARKASAKRPRKASAKRTKAADLPIMRTAFDANVKRHEAAAWCGKAHHVNAGGYRVAVPGMVTQAAATAATAVSPRVGTNVWLALAMYFTARVSKAGKVSHGATQAMVTALCGGPQLNKARGLVAAGRAGELRHKAPCVLTGRTVEWYGLALAKGK